MSFVARIKFRRIIQQRSRASFTARFGAEYILPPAVMKLVSCRSRIQMSCSSERAPRSWVLLKKPKNRASEDPRGYLSDFMEQKRDRIKILLVALWVAFTVTLAGWWLVFGLRQLDRLSQLHVEQANQLHQHYQMLMWEGGVLIASLIGGGLALYYYARR